MNMLAELFRKMGNARDNLNSGTLDVKQSEGLWELDDARDIVEQMLRDREDECVNQSANKG